MVLSRMGLASGYDFGAGAYYYADIPGFERIVRDDVYHTDIPDQGCDMDLRDECS